MSEYHPNLPRPTRPKFTLRQAWQYWPVLVWLGVIAVAYWTYIKGAKFERLNAAVDVLQETITPANEGILAEVYVKSGDLVKKGDKIALMDTTKIDDDIRRMESNMREEHAQAIREARIDISRRRQELREIERDEASDMGELSAIKPYLDMAAALRKSGNAAAAQLVGKYEADAARLNALINIYPRQKREIADELSHFEQRLATLEKNDPIAGVANEASDILELQSLKKKRERYTLVASHDGQIERSGKEIGELIKPGEPIARIVANAKTITGFIPQDQRQLISIGQKVWVTSASNRREFYETKVISISPSVISVPDATSPLPNKRLHGQKATVDYPTDPTCNFVPGEMIVIQLDKPGRIPFFTRIFGSSNTKQ